MRIRITQDDLMFMLEQRFDRHFKRINSIQLDVTDPNEYELVIQIESFLEDIK